MKKILFLAVSFVMALAVNAQNAGTDITSQFENADFEAGSSNGWTVTGPANKQNLGTANTAANNGYQGTYFMEAWKPSGSSLNDFEWSQTKNVPNGFYVVKALAHSIEQSKDVTPQGTFIFAEDKQVEVTTTTASEYTVVAEVTDDTLTIGYRGVGCNANWTACDYFRIIQCYGETEDAAKLSWVKYELNLLQAEAEELMSSDMSTTVRAGLEASIAAIANLTNYADADALWQTMKKQVADAKTSIEGYEKLMAKIEDIIANVLIDAEMNGYAELEAVVYAVMDKYTAGSIENAGVESELKALDEAVFAFRVANADGTESFDVTDMFVTNPTVRTKDATAGWTIEGGRTDPNMPAWGHNTMEFWNCDFTLSQTIKDLPNGKYVIKVQGFYREGAMNNGSNLGKENITAELFGNKSAVPLTSIYQYTASSMGVTVNVHGTHDYINGLEGANAAFNILNTATGRNYYDDNELMVIVMDNTLTFGIRNTSTVFDRWCAFRDFRLEYFGNFPGINLAGKIQEYKNYMEDNIDNIPYAVYLEMAGYIWEVEESGLTSPDAAEAEVNAAILALDSVWAEAQVSFGIYEDLKALASRVENESLPLNYPGKEALQNVLKEAQTYFVPETEINTREAMLAMIDKLDAAIVAYVFSQTYTREKPADVSYYLVEAFLQTKNYDIPVWKVDNAGEDKGDVWVGPGRDWIVGVDTTKMYCLNTWSNNFVSMNVYQEITGLPNGLYSVSADAVTQNDCLNDQHAYISSSMGVAISDTLSIEGWDKQEWETLTTDLLVVADGKLRIGFASTSTGTPGTNGWFQVANFVLKYHGEATAEDMKAAWESTLARANETVDILLIGDEGSLITTIGAATPLAADAKYAEACGMLNPAIDDVSYAANVTKKFYNSNYKTLDTDTTYAKYEYVPVLADGTISLVDGMLAVDTTTHRALDAFNDKLSAYVKYISGLKEVEDMLNDTTKAYDEKFVNFLVETVIKGHIDTLTFKLHASVDVDTLLIRLKNAANRLERTILKDASEGDVTSLIENPTIDVVEDKLAGWVVEKNNATNCGTNKSEHYSGDAANTYLDAWNGTAGKNDATFYQELTGIPNGLYRLTAAARTDGANAWIFAAPETPKAESTGWAMVKNVGAWGGEIWEAAKAEWEAAGKPADGEFPFFTTRADSTGFGWSWHVIDSIEVTDRYLMIGLSANKGFCGKEEGFSGTWMGADDWKLELIKKTEDGTYDPYTGVEEIEVVAPVVQGIYDLFGRRINVVTESGIYIVNGKKMFIKK